MRTDTRKSSTHGSVFSTGSIAEEALNAIALIDKEAKQKTIAQLQSLEEARQSILQRKAEIDHQIAQIDQAIASVTGTSDKAIRRSRRNLDQQREQVSQWLGSRRGQKFQAGGIVREFPELDGVVMSAFMKPLIQSGEVKTDVSEGIRRTRYFVPSP